MTTKPFEELMSEINSMNIEEALENAEKCLEAFEVRDIIKQQQETINRQKAEIERLNGEIKERDKFIDTVYERAEKHYCELTEDIKEIITKKSKAEAVKEFVMRFEKKIRDVKFTLGQTWEIQSALKEVEKEMMGDET